MTCQQPRTKPQMPTPAASPGPKQPRRRNSANCAQATKNRTSLKAETAWVHASHPKRLRPKQPRRRHRPETAWSRESSWRAAAQRSSSTAAPSERHPPDCQPAAQACVQEAAREAGPCMHAHEAAHYAPPALAEVPMEPPPSQAVVVAQWVDDHHRGNGAATLASRRNADAEMVGFSPKCWSR